MNLWVDGGGTAKVQTYFSYKCIETEQKNYNPVAMNRFYLVNLAYELIPQGCSIFDAEGHQTNNIAEFAALYYGLLRFKKFYDYHSVTIHHDSQIVQRAVLGLNSCYAEHLIPWLNAVRSLWWPQIDYQWVKREEVVKILGH